MTIELSFTKGHGTGNDFVIFADPDGRIELDGAALARLADRRFGVGADGVIRAVRSSNLHAGAAALAEDPDAEWFMDYANSDGSVSEMCGNGIRVFVHYLIENRFVTLAEEESIAIGTRAGVRTVRRTAEGFAADLGRWSFEGGEPLVRARGLPVARPGLGINVGNPHVVVALAGDDELASLDLTLSLIHI